MSKTPKSSPVQNGAIPHIGAADLDAAENEHQARKQAEQAESGTLPGAAPAGGEPQILEATDAELEASAGPDEQIASLQEQLLRMGADFENFRKRSRTEQQEQRRYSIQQVLSDMLPVIDNLERALLHAPPDNKDPVIEGVRMVAKQWHDVLSNYGVKTFKSLGARFDPERHEAVGQQTDPANAPGTILTEHVSGYTIYERLLRPARVVVADQASGTQLT